MSLSAECEFVAICSATNVVLGAEWPLLWCSSCTGRRFLIFPEMKMSSILLSKKLPGPVFLSEEAVKEMFGGTEKVKSLWLSSGSAIVNSQ
jgi:hypothetical protein